MYAWPALVIAAIGCGGDNRDVVPGTCLAVSPDGEVYDPGTPGEHGAPASPGGFDDRRPATARSFMVVANHPVASKAGCDILRRGGSAIDAAVAVQMVLALVEPQSSGLGGGGFLVGYDAATGAVYSFDGRETAPGAATENYLRWNSDAQQTPPLPDARASGRSIGTPGILRMLYTVQRARGRLPWADLFAPAIQLAGDGVRIGPRLGRAIMNQAPGLARDAETRAQFLDGNGQPKPAGAVLTYPALAATMQAIAAGGADAFYTGAIANDLLDEIADTTGGITPGATTPGDLAGYTAMLREPLCVPYRDYTVCGMGPPAGGIAVAQTLGILEHFDLASHPPAGIDDNGGRPDVMAVHLISEAERLAYADRDRYITDPAFMTAPSTGIGALLDPSYLAQRAALIDPAHSMGTAAPGEFAMALGDPPPAAEHGTTQITVIDDAGNAIALTSTIEAEFGSLHMTRGGVLLNNQLTDFSADPADAQGRPIANRVAAGKRPRSSTSPTLVFRGAGRDLVLATGSPGGITIIQYVTKSLVAMLDWKLDAQQAAALVDFGAANTPVTNVGGEHPAIDASSGGARDPLVTGLAALGHMVNVSQQSSGVASIIVRTTPTGVRYYEGGADPRREGVALGDTFRP
jgi:gamma-glutamyltranspeptidase/glutathione hydrolase